ncbi:peptide deformylase [Actinomadura livida]|uniref:Peptide deformylase n=1 Tax=Actinomadura livida TaxID=79909 RepID=A0A7W7MWQ7_9ACTN|nr:MULTISPECIES: peptide deformylase [Actinomadura]MBB4773976.1 peptide deformylase [Actinomadura catellatispora]GGT85775.1 peptide deformylase [Actinomadura livida]
MAVRPTVQLGDPLLRTPCAEIRDPGGAETAELVTDLADTLADWVRRTGYGRGIAAPQIGAPVRLVYLHLDRPWVLVNPAIVARSESTWEPWDACLSFSVEIFCKVRRSTWVDVTYTSPGGERHDLRADGELGELLQHEIDHLDGVVAVDRMTSVETLCMRSEFERRHRAESPYRR